MAGGGSGLEPGARIPAEGPPALPLPTIPLGSIPESQGDPTWANRSPLLPSIFFQVPLWPDQFTFFLFHAGVAYDLPRTGRADQTMGGS